MPYSYSKILRLRYYNKYFYIKKNLHVKKWRVKK
nr:MAG TPA: hypothetical protein [Caudoviricetes sp.]